MLAGQDLLVILIIALLIFGGNRIGDLGAGLGKGIRNFKKGLQGEDTKTPSEGSEETPQKRKE
jgi:sec-independent protein translocase protein TatA